MNREILRLAIPNILSNISVPLLSTVDTALMGRLSEEHIGAVGLGAMIFNFIYWNFGFLRMGTTGMTAQSYGRLKNDESIVILARALAVSAAIAALILVCQDLIREGGAFLMQADEALYPYISEYIQIRIWAAPATLGLYVMMGWFFGMQNAIYPLILTLFTNVLNMALSYWFVFHLDMEIAGVAWGTLIAQYAGILLGIGLFFSRYKAFLRDFHARAFRKWTEFSRFLKINGDIFVRTFLLTFVFGFFYSQSSGFGPELLAVNVILLQYVNWISYVIDGFAFASESLVGKYFGARDRSRLSLAIRYIFYWSAALSLAIMAIYGLFGVELLYVFTDQTQVIAMAKPYLWWVVLFPVLGFACYIWDGIYVGLTASKAMRNTMLIAIVLFLAAYYPLKIQFGNHGLWAALLVFLLARGLVQSLFFLKYRFALQ